MLLYTSEDYVIKDKVSQAVHPPPAKDMDLIDLDNLQKDILQFGTNQVFIYKFSHVNRRKYWIEIQ